MSQLGHDFAVMQAISPSFIPNWRLSLPIQVRTQL